MLKTTYGIVYNREDGGDVTHDSEFEGYDTEKERDEKFLAWESDCYKAILIVEIPDEKQSKACICYSIAGSESTCPAHGL